jgi:hypothetical protein
MSITLLGTCRIDSIPGHNNLNNLINYPHSTKEVIQMLEFISGKKDLKSPYNLLCLRAAIIETVYPGSISRETGLPENVIFERFELTESNGKKHILQQTSIVEKFNQTEVFVIEISSVKNYTHNGHYLHHLCVDERFPDYKSITPVEILDEHTVNKQSEAEIEKDILKIVEMLSPKKILIVSHFNYKNGTEFIPSRNDLVRTLERICERNGIAFANPAELLSEHDQNLTMGSDSEHYTPLGKVLIGEKLSQMIDKLA